MNRIEVGEPYLNRSGPSKEGFELSLSGSLPQLTLGFPRLSPEEIECVKSGPSRFGVAEVEGVLFFLFRFDPCIAWSDTPYHRALEEAVRPVKLALLQERSRAVLQVVLVSAEDSIVQAIRLVALDPPTTRALWQAVLLQDSLPPDYDAWIARVYGRYSSRELARLGVTSRGGA